MFARLEPWCHDRRRLVLVLWIGLLVAFNVVAGAIGPDYRADFSLPGAESTDGFEILKADHGRPASPSWTTDHVGLKVATGYAAPNGLPPRLTGSPRPP